jgi:multiple sugar transport system ATP-binding protein
MAFITLDHVSKAFGDSRIIHDVNLQIADGEFCVLVGPSGCGKSTLLRMIAGLETLSAGQLHIGTRNVTHLAPKDRNIAMVFQSYALYPQMTVRENMGFGLKLMKLPKDEIRRRVDAAAAMLELQPLMERRPAQLSGGQRQRVAMGRAMVREPAAFLFDEPLSNLDAALRSAVRGEIRAMHQRSRTTSVYVTHDQVEAMTMGDRIVVLRAGRVEQAGTPVELYDRPVNRFVAQFIGSPSMNLLELPVTKAKGGVRAQWQPNGSAEAAPWILPAYAQHQSQVVLGIRPEHVQLAGQSTNDNAYPLAARLQALEFTGGQTMLMLDTPAGRMTLCQQERPTVRAGDNLDLRLPRDRLHWFDAASGQRVDAES